jgi:hypothetical protein
MQRHFKYRLLKLERVETHSNYPVNFFFSLLRFHFHLEYSKPSLCVRGLAQPVKCQYRGIIVNVATHAF